MGYMPTSTDDNQLETGTKRINREGQLNMHKNTTIKKTKTGITITLKENMPKVGAVLKTKDGNRKENFQSLQENVLQCVVKNYKKWVDLATLTRKLEDL